MIPFLFADATNAAEVGDPLFSNGVDAAVIGIVVLKVFVTFAVALVATMFMIWFERKVISDMQNRIGPDKAGGKFGPLQSLADGIKLFFKEDLFPEKADKPIFRIAPYLSVIPAFLALCIVPLGPVVTIFGHQTRLQVADPPIGILWLLVMSSIAVYGIMLAGWSSGSKYPLLGSVRASAQMVSYEAALGLSGRCCCSRHRRIANEFDCRRASATNWRDHFCFWSRPSALVSQLEHSRACARAFHHFCDLCNCRIEPPSVRPR